MDACLKTSYWQFYRYIYFIAKIRYFLSVSIRLLLTKSLTFILFLKNTCSILHNVVVLTIFGINEHQTQDMMTELNFYPICLDLTLKSTPLQISRKHLYNRVCSAVQYNLNKLCLFMKSSNFTKYIQFYTSDLYYNKQYIYCYFNQFFFILHNCWLG